MEHKLVVLALALLALAGTASGQAPPEENLTENVTKEADGLVKGLLEDVGHATEAVGDGAQEVGKGVTSAAKSLGALVRDALQFTGKLASSAGDWASAAGLAVGITLAAATGSGLGSLANGLAAGAGSLTGGASFAAIGVGHGLAFLGDGLWSTILAYTGLVGSLRPEAMPPAAFAGVVAASSASTAGVGGWAGWNVLRKWGILGGAVAGFSRIQDNELLDHPVRGELYQLIQENPGIHASQLSRKSGAAWGSVTHHLDKLQKARMVTTRRVNNQKCFFQNGGSVGRSDMETLSAVKGDTASKVAGFVMHHPMTNQKSLAKELGISAALTSFHVRKLVNLGVLDRVRHGKETLLTTSESFLRILESRESPLPAMQAADEMPYSA